MRKVTIFENEILIEGFDYTDLHREGMGSCRDVARVGLAWALRKLSEDIEKDMNGDWDNQISGVD